MSGCVGRAVVVGVAVVVLVCSCSGGAGGAGVRQSSPVATSSSPVVTSLPPVSSMPVKPQPSETFTPEQLEAANTVIEFFHVLDGVLSDPDAETQPLVNITMGQTQTIQLGRVSEYREQGRIQTGTVGVHITGASEARKEDGLEVIAVRVCTDTTSYDVVDAKTGESVMKPGEHPLYLTWNIDVIKVGEGWKIGDATNEDVLGCSA